MLRMFARANVISLVFVVVFFGETNPCYKRALAEAYFAE